MVSSAETTPPLPYQVMSLSSFGTTAGGERVRGCADTFLSRHEDRDGGHFFVHSFALHLFSRHAGTSSSEINMNISCRVILMTCKYGIPGF